MSDCESDSVALYGVHVYGNVRIRGKFGSLKLGKVYDPTKDGTYWRWGFTVQDGQIRVRGEIGTLEVDARSITKRAEGLAALSVGDAQPTGDQASARADRISQSTKVLSNEVTEDEVAGVMGLPVDLRDSPKDGLPPYLTLEGSTVDSVVVPADYLSEDSGLICFVGASIGSIEYLGSEKPSLPVADYPDPRKQGLGLGARMVAAWQRMVAAWQRMVAAWQRTVRRASLLASTLAHRPEGRMSARAVPRATDLPSLTMVRAYSRAHFDAGSYDTLARSLSTQGKTKEAKRVLVQRHEDERRWGRLGWWARKWNWVNGAVVGHGYLIHRAVLAIAILVVAAGLLVLGGQKADQFAPVQPELITANAKAVALTDESTSQTPADAMSPNSCGRLYPCFDPVIYTLDTLIPISNFHQTEYWQPVDGWWGRMVLAGCTALVWILTTILIASLSSVARREHEQRGP